ncbi:MAG: hypothetical protein ACUVSS_05805, partial [Anaerolineae bacterium]
LLRPLVLAGLLWCALALSAHAGETGTASITVLPADGQTHGVQLRAQTVDAVIRQEKGDLWADTHIWVYLYNPGKKAVVMPVSLPGPQLAPAELPADLELVLDRTPLVLTPLQPQEGFAPVRASTVITVPARGAASLRINYRQALPVQDGLAAFAYFLSETAKWSGRPESLRVTVRFDPPLAGGRLLGMAPAPHRRTDGELTWHWENTKATQNIGLAFIAPSWWAELEEARRQATPEAGLESYRELADRYWHLANLTPPVFQSEGYFERFFPAAVAALQAGLANPSPAATPDAIVAARLQLARFYLAQADRLEDERAVPYLQAAADELDAALALRPEYADARQAAGELRSRLAALARGRGDLPAFQEQQARLAALATPAGLPSPEVLSRYEALDLAEAALAQGDRAAAARLIAAAFGPNAVAVIGVPAPRARQTLVKVTTEPTAKRIEVQLAGDAAEIRPLLAQTAAALAGIPAVAVEENRLAFTLPFADVGQLSATQARAALALADIPELALLAAALQPLEQGWQVMEGPFLTAERYVELVDLTAAQEAWVAHAQALEAAAATASAQEGPSLAARVARVQGMLWAGDAAAWRALARDSRITYCVTLRTSAVTRTWELAPGETRHLTAETQAWRYERLAWVAGGMALLLALAVYTVWKAGRA